MGKTLTVGRLLPCDCLISKLCEQEVWPLCKTKRCWIVDIIKEEMIVGLFLPAQCTKSGVATLRCVALRHVATRSCLNANTVPIALPLCSFSRCVSVRTWQRHQATIRKSSAELTASVAHYRKATLCACECVRNLLLITCTGSFKGKVSVLSSEPFRKCPPPPFPHVSQTLNCPWTHRPTQTSKWWCHRFQQSSQHLAVFLEHWPVTLVLRCLWWFPPSTSSLENLLDVNFLTSTTENRNVTKLLFWQQQTELQMFSKNEAALWRAEFLSALL